MQPPLDERLICILRRPAGLASLVSRPRRPFERPRPVPEEKAEPLAELDPYVEEVRPVGHQDLPDIQASWDSLARVSVFDAQTLFHVLQVLIYTLPEGEVSDVPPLKIAPPPPPVRPTAAHPRAYRGTKYRPPKGKRMAPIDLRPHLCVPGDTNRLLRHLAPFLPEAKPLLERDDLSPDQFSPLIERNGKATDPYLQYCHSAGDRSVYDLPARFRSHLLFWLRGQPWSAVADALALYWGLGLETEAALLRCFARFLAELPLRPCLDWGRILLQQPVPRRVAFAELLIKAGVQGRPPSEALREAVAEVDRLSPDHVYRHRMYTLLVSSRNGNLGYLLDGFRLAQRHKVDHEFEEVGHCDDFPIGLVEEFSEHVTTKDAGWRRRNALSLWEDCAKLAGFTRLLETRPWQGLEPDVAYDAVNLFREGYCELDEPAIQAKWRVLRDFAPRLFALLHAAEPDYRYKAVRCLLDLAWFWDEPHALAQNLERYRLLLPRLCRQPFAREPIPYPLTSLTRLPPFEWAELAASEERSFLKLERETRRGKAGLIADGLETLAETAGAWTVRAFGRCPSHLFEAARVLGCMGVTARREVIRSWLEHPLLTLDAEGMPVEQLVREIERHRPADVCNPIPRKLRNASLGRRQLRPGQVQRALRVLLADLNATRVELLHRLALDRLARAVGPAPDTVAARHAVCLQGFIHDNRRALRRFLRAYFGGQRGYLLDHPVSRGWLARHPRVAQTWLRGLRRRVTLPGSCEAYLAVEQDPLEVLRLGTHVGTCLGLGGMMAHSAAAVVLDVNKHVVYARDGSGAILGRQLLALSEDDRLVCFPVYPVEAPPRLKRAFWDYDRALADVLKVAIHDPNASAADYKIAGLLSSCWWEDDPWDGRKK
jgi:hypothetical protein